MIRIANTQDIEQMVGLAFDFHSESNQPLDFDEEKTKEHLALSLKSPEYFPMVSVIHGEVTGMIVGYIGAPAFSSDLQAIEVCWYVLPPYRGKPDSIRLIKAYEKWAVNMGARAVTLTYLDGVQDLTPLFKRSGYKRSESNFIKEI